MTETLLIYLHSCAAGSCFVARASCACCQVLRMTLVVAEKAIFHLSFRGKMAKQGRDDTLFNEFMHHPTLTVLVKVERSPHDCHFPPVSGVGLKTLGILYHRSMMRTQSSRGDSLCKPSVLHFVVLRCGNRWAHLSCCVSIHAIGVQSYPSEFGRGARGEDDLQITTTTISPDSPIR